MKTLHLRIDVDLDGRVANGDLDVVVVVDFEDASVAEGFS